MTTRWLGVLAFSGLVVAGCSSEGQIICEKRDECNMLIGTSVEECTERVDESGGDGARADCATCMDEKSCSSIRSGSCLSDCASVNIDTLFE